MAYKTMYCDIDSTIWKLDDWVCDSVRELFGIELRPEDFTTWDTIPNLIGSNWFKVYEHALAPERIPDRKMYEGVEDALTALFYDGFNLHFISHNPKPKIMYDPVLMWLQDILPDVEHFSFTLYGSRNDKIETMKSDPTAWGIIEDKPSTLKKAAANGFNTYAKLQPYNLLTVQENPAIIGFEDWVELPDLVAIKEGTFV